MYHARRRFLLKGQQLEKGDVADLSGITRPEGLIRSGFVEWQGEGKRDAIHREAFRPEFYAAKPKRARAKKTTTNAVPRALVLGKKVPA